MLRPGGPTLAFDVEIRKGICTTNAIEFARPSANPSIKGHLPHGEHAQRPDDSP